MSSVIGEHVLRQLVVGWLCEGALPFVTFPFGRWFCLGRPQAIFVAGHGGFFFGVAARCLGQGMLHLCQCLGHFSSSASAIFTVGPHVGPAQFGGPQVGLLLVLVYRRAEIEVHCNTLYITPNTQHTRLNTYN